METILKILSALMRVVLPSSICNAIESRVKKTIKVMTNTRTLKLFWVVVLFPVRLLLDLFISSAKMIFIWLLPQKTLGHARYIVKLFVTDKAVRKMSTSRAIKRSKLCLELFTKGAEKRVRFGDKNPEITFFVIRPYYFNELNELITTRSNLLYHYYRNLQHLSYAVEKGWVPVVDWQNYGPLPHQEDYPIHGTMNGWEYFWDQPSKYTLEEVYQSKNVILSDQNTVSYGYIPPVAITAPFMSYAKRLADNCPKYDSLIHFNRPTEEYIEEYQRSLFPVNGKILGVSVRGVSYGAKDIPGHPKQPKVTELITTVEKVMEEWKMDYIFFTCEYAPTVEAMQKAFGDKMIFMPRSRYEDLPTKDANPLYEPGRRYQTNLEYVTEMALLSRCNSLLAGMSGGVRAAIIWNGNQYEHMKIFDNGMY